MDSAIGRIPYRFSLTTDCSFRQYLSVAATVAIPLEDGGLQLGPARLRGSSSLRFLTKPELKEMKKVGRSIGHARNTFVPKHTPEWYREQSLEYALGNRVSKPAARPTNGRRADQCSDVKPEEGDGTRRFQPAVNDAASVIVTAAHSDKRVSDCKRAALVGQRPAR